VCPWPRDPGRPAAPPRPGRSGASIRGVGAETGAVVVDLDDLGGPPLVLPDAVHPTAVGQLEIAARAAAALRAAGGPVPRDPPQPAAVPRRPRRRRPLGRALRDPARQGPAPPRGGASPPARVTFRIHGMQNVTGARLRAC